ncbi:SAC3/GANP/Nin1/mts3/eIF-3 p25 family-domain-containing protein [Melampsora americana]|nr:SAC3/GANP/Nin1/mts3/eIF-3 p25 family-domain-containing protein [Melampsora americana]
MAQLENKKRQFSSEPPIEAFDEPTSRFDSSPAGNRFLELKPHRDAERVQAVNLGLIPDPLKPRRLDEALPFFGTCTQMCPEFERHEREYQNNTDRWERYPGTMRIDPLKAVKAFHRPAAGNDQPLPSDVRPPHILKSTLDYLFNDLLPQESLFETHGFIRDRTRSIRQDFTLQNERGSMAIECHERIARYHIMCLHFLRDKEGVGSYQEQQELEQVRKVLQSLNEFYDDFRGSNQLWPHEAEFRAYYLLTHLRDADAARTTERLPQVIFLDPRLQSALKLHALAQCSNLTKAPSGRRPTSSPATLNGFSRLFKQISSPQTSFLAACLLETHFRDIRVAALKAIRSAQSRMYGAKLPLKALARACAMPILQECLDFCVACGLKIARTADLSECTVELHNHVTFDDHSITFRMPKSSMVTEKSLNISISDFINGVHANAKVPTASRPAPPLSSRSAQQKKTGRVELVPSTSLPLKSLRDQKVPLDNSATSRLVIHANIHPSDKAGDKSTSRRISTISQLTPGLLKPHAMVQASQMSPASPKFANIPPAKRETPSRSTIPSSSQTNHPSPKPPTRKRSSVLSASCSKTLQVSARSSAQKHLISSLCSEVMSGLIAPIASKVAQQALRNRVMCSLAEQNQINKHYIKYFAEGLQKQFFSELNRRFAFKIASSLIFEQHNDKREQRLIGTTFRKWFESTRSLRPNPAKRYRRATDARAEGVSSDIDPSLWRPGGLKDCVCTFLNQIFFGLEDATVEVVVILPGESPLVYTWLCCKFGIDSKHLSDQWTIQENGLRVFLSFFKEADKIVPERLSRVALLLLWYDDTCEPTVTMNRYDNHTRWVKSVSCSSFYHVTSLGISLHTPSSATTPVNAPSELEIIHLSLDNSEHEMEEALQHRLHLLESSTDTLADLEDRISPYLSTWQDYQLKALDRLSCPSEASQEANRHRSITVQNSDPDIDILDMVRLFTFVSATIDLMVTTIGSLIGPPDKVVEIDITPLRLDMISTMACENFYSTFRKYKYSLPINYYSNNLRALLCAQPPLSLVQFFPLFCRHLASAILEIVHTTAESIGRPRCLAQRHEKSKAHAILPEFELQLQAMLQGLPLDPVNKRRRSNEQSSLNTSGESHSLLDLTGGAKRRIDEDMLSNEENLELNSPSPSITTPIKNHDLKKKPSRAHMVSELQKLVQSIKTNQG